MNIIKITANENGGRPSLQSWDRPEPPEGYAFVQCDTSQFYEFRGFVDIAVQDGMCTEIIGNQEALDAYLEEYPDVEPEPAPDYMAFIAGLMEGYANEGA